MGNPLSRAMDKQAEKNKEFMENMQQTTLCRQLEMQNCMRERMMAAQLARGRDLFYWFASFYAVALVGAVAGARHGKRAAVAPMVPLTFILGYQWDLCYGGKMDRIRGMAENILADEQQLVALPGGSVSLSEIEQRRLQQR